jgi:imidazolonepropionase-like amidohydrolase
VPHRHPSLLAAPPPAAGRLWLTGARLFDGTSAPVRDGAAVLISDGVIERVGAAGDAVPDGARVLDLGGRMLLPGLINVHVHVQGRQPEPVHGAEPLLQSTSAHFLQASLRDTLRMGVTTLRNVGSQRLQPQEARQAMRYGAFRGPRLLTCGLIISATAPGGRFYGAMYREADGPDEMRKAVREQLRDGADFIKVMTTGARSNELEDPEPSQMTDAGFAWGRARDGPSDLTLGGYLCAAAAPGASSMPTSGGPSGTPQPLTASKPGPALNPHAGGVDVLSPEVMSRHTEVPSGWPSGPPP